MNLRHNTMRRPTFLLLDYFAVRDRKIIQYLAIATLILCLLPTLLQGMGVDFGIVPASLDELIVKQQSSTQISDAIHGILAGSFVHTILEWSAFCTGVLTAILAFVHFALNRDLATPIIGLSLFYAGCMDAFHTLAADRLITGVASPETLIPFTWAICRLFSALILMVGVSLFLLTPKRFYPQRQLSVLVWASLLAAIAAYLMILICVRLETLPQTMFPDSLITRPWDIAPLLLFVVIGLFLFPRFNRRYPNLFTQSLIISSLPQVAVQLHMSFGSRVLFDSDFNIAHFLKILAYLIPFIGLCLTYIQIHREKENIVQKLMAAEQDLKQKQEQLKQTVRELKNTQSQLVQSEKMSSLGQLVAGVAHEINNPVNFIYGNFTHAEKYINEIRQIFDLYRYYYPNPHPKIQEEMDEVELDYLLEDFNRILKSMRLGSERIRNIVLSLRNFSRLDEADAKEIDIHEGIESTLLILGNQLKAKSDRPAIEIVKNYSEFPVIDCYPSQLNQVFMNILTNAIDALTQKCKQQPDFQPQISIATEFRESQCNIKIQDNGPGIPEEIQSKIFDPFFTTKSIGQGTGLGLSISYKIVTEKHQGQLVCSSSAETGTLFEIIIPQHLSGKE